MKLINGYKCSRYFSGSHGPKLIPTIQSNTILVRVQCNTRDTVAAVSTAVRCAPLSPFKASRYIPVIGDWNAGTGAPTGHPTHLSNPPTHSVASTGSHPSPGKSNAPPASATNAKTPADVNGRVCVFWFHFMRNQIHLWGKIVLREAMTRHILVPLQVESQLLDRSKPCEQLRMKREAWEKKAGS